MTELAIETDNLTKSYGTKCVVDRLSLAVPAGAVYGFLGPNGAGKTTTIRMLLGLVRPTSGSVRLFGREITGPRPDRRAVPELCGAIVEHPAFYRHLSGRRNLEVIRLSSGFAVDRARLDELLDVVGLSARGEDRVSEYSLGMKQRLGIAAALLADPRILFLDEPTNGLDPGGTVEIRALLRTLAECGTTVFVSSHLLHEVQTTCTHVGVLSRGRLLADGPIDTLLAGSKRVRFEVDSADAALRALACAPAWTARAVSRTEILAEIDRADVPAALTRLLGAGVAVYSVAPEASSLETAFHEIVNAGEQPDAAEVTK